MSSQETQAKPNIKQFITICVIAFAIFFSNQMVQNTVTKFANSMSTTTRMLGFLGGVWGLASLLTRPFAGQVVDNENHQVLLRVSVLLLLVSNLILVEAKTVPLLLLSRVVNGFAWGFGSTLCMTTACNALPKEKVAGGIGIYTMMQVLAQVCGPSLAIYIIAKTSFHTLYCFTSMVMVIAFCLTFLFQTNQQRPEVRHYAFSLHDMVAPKAFIPATLLMCNIMQISAVAAFLLLYADERRITGLSFFFSLQAISIVVTRPFVSKWINPKNSFVFTLVSEVFLVIGLLSLFFARNIGYFVFAALMFGFGKSGSHPALMGMCVAAVPKTERGRASNTAYAFQDLGQVFGANIAGFFAEIWGYGAAFLSIAIIISLCTVFFIGAYMIPNIYRMKQEGV